EIPKKCHRVTLKFAKFLRIFLYLGHLSRPQGMETNVPPSWCITLQTCARDTRLLPFPNRKEGSSRCTGWFAWLVLEARKTARSFRALLNDRHLRRALHGD